MSEVADKLREARALIEDPERWCQGISARTADGTATYATDPDACQWCAVSAAVRIAGDRAPGAVRPCRELVDHLDAAAAKFNKSFAADVNDELGHAHVLTLYDRAIELAEQQ